MRTAWRLNELYGLGFDYVHRRRKQIETVTIDSVNRGRPEIFDG